MPHLDFKLRFTTPAFLGAAVRGEKTVSYLRTDRESGELREETKQVPYYPVDSGGVRVPTLRGALEFWYRSLWAALPPSEVFAHQESVFGSVRVGQGVRLRPTQVPQLPEGDELRYDDEAERQAAVYLGYGPLQLLTVKNPRRPSAGMSIATSHNASQWRDALLVREPALEFGFRAEGSEHQVQGVQWALTLLHLFGGLGARSRRGWGSVEVAADFLSAEEVGGALAGRLSAGFARLWPEAEPAPAGPASSRPPRPSAVAARPAFSAFSSQARIYVTAPLEGSYFAVLQAFYESFRRVRSFRDREPTAVADHDREWRDVQSPAAGLQDVPVRLAFGMPYQPRFRNQSRIEYVGRLPHGGGEEVTRRSSPLLLKVVRLAPDWHAGVALFLAADFFGEQGLEVGAKVHWKVGGRSLPKPVPKTRPFPEYKAIDEFFQSGDWTKVSLP